MTRSFSFRTAGLLLLGACLSLPLSANVQFMTVMASAMPYIGRG